MNNSTFDRTSLRLSATLLLVGQTLYVVITLFHTGGEANDHHAIFAAYAASEKAARFATAEAIGWLEWGSRRYENFVSR